MYTNNITEVVSDQHFRLNQVGFWLKMVAGWKREINNMLERNYSIGASPDIIIHLEKVKSELSETVEKLDELSRLLAMHKVTLPYTDSSRVEWMNAQSLQQECVHNESKKIPKPVK